MIWGGRGTNARYLCKGDFDDGGQYCVGFGGASVDRRVGQELLRVISPLGVNASLRALEQLSAGDAAQRIALSSKLDQLGYEARKAFEQYDAVDARNRLVASELERRWNEKLEEIETTKQRLASLNGKRYSLSAQEEGRILAMGGLATARRNHAITGQRRALPDPDRVSLNEAARICGVSSSTIGRLVEAGMLKSEQVTPRAPWGICRADLNSEPVQSTIDKLLRTGKLILKGGCAEEQPALFIENEGDDNAGHHE